MIAAIRRSILFVLCLPAFTIIPTIARAQSSDPLPEVRERLKIEGQRIEKEVQDGRMKAYRLLRSDPEEAVDTLKGLIGVLRKDVALSDAKRESLLGTVQRDISNLRALTSVRRTSETVAAQVDARRAIEPRGGGSDQKSVYDVATSRIRSMQGRSAESRNVRERSSERLTTAMTEVDRSSQPASSEYELPADWQEKSKKRSGLAKLTEQEKALLEALQKPIKVDYSMETFQSVIDDLSKKMGQNILIDKQSLEEANVTYDTPITLRFNKAVAARTALKRVLADVGLTYVVRKETIEVTTLARAREMMTTRTYYIGDLVGIASPMLPAAVNEFQMIQAIGNIISQIQGLDPESWEGRGGPGTISFDAVRMALIIKQSAEVHFMLNSSR